MNVAGHLHVVVRVSGGAPWASWHAACLDCPWSGPARESHGQALADAEAHAYGEISALL